MTQFTAEDLQLIVDALASHKTWLQKTMAGARFSPDLNDRLKRLSELQAKVITMQQLSDTRSGNP